MTHWKQERLEIIMSGLLNKKFLQSIGVSIEDHVFEALSEHYEETLTERVISEIVDELDEAQLKQLHELKAADPETLNQWLASTVPELDEIVEDEIAILLGEIAGSAEKL